MDIELPCTDYHWLFDPDLTDLDMSFHRITIQGGRSEDVDVRVKTLYGASEETLDLPDSDNQVLHKRRRRGCRGGRSVRAGKVAVLQRKLAELEVQLNKLRSQDKQDQHASSRKRRRE